MHNSQGKPPQPSSINLKRESIIKQEAIFNDRDSFVEIKIEAENENRNKNESRNNERVIVDLTED